MVTVLQICSLSLMLWTDIKESLMMKPSAPISSALASIHYVHSTLFEYQAPIASKTTSQTPFLCVCVSIIGQPDSTHSTTGQQVQISWPQALGYFALYGPLGVCDLFWMLPWQLAYSASVFSRWCFFWAWCNLLFFPLFAIQTAVSKGDLSESFPLICTLSNLPTVLKVNLIATVKHTLCSSTNKKQM